MIARSVLGFKDLSTAECRDFTDVLLVVVNGICMAYCTFSKSANVEAYYFILGLYFFGSLVCALNARLVLHSHSRTTLYYFTLISTASIPIGLAYLLDSISPLAHLYRIATFASAWLYSTLSANFALFLQPTNKRLLIITPLGLVYAVMASFPTLIHK